MAKKQQELATRNNGELAFLGDYKSTGAGLPTKTDDFLIPMAKVLGPQSPEVLKGNPALVKGAEAGDILIKNAPKPLVKAEQGLLFQPCFRDEAVIEWLARGKGGGGGSGFVARHPHDYLETSDNVKRVQDPNAKTSKDARMIWINAKTGNSLTHTRYVSGYMISDNSPPMPLVLPFSSTGHTVAKQWNMMMANQRLPNSDTPVDIWLVYYRVSTKLRTRGDQSWYIFDVSNAAKDGAPMFIKTREDADRGRNLHESLSRKERDIAVADQDQPDDQAM